MADPKLKKPTAEQIEEWKQIYEVLIHFSQMILQTRSIAFSLILAAYGAAALVASQPVNILINTQDSKIQEKAALALRISDLEISPGATIVLFSLLSLLAVFIIDYFYYFKLLIGAVEVCQKYEDENNISSRLANNLSVTIPRKISHLVVFLYYGIPAFTGFILFWMFL
jgi:hypothetical protein